MKTMRRISCMAVITLAACGMEPSPIDEPIETVETIQSAVTTAPFTDASGKVKVSIRTCDWVGPALANQATCTPDADWVMVGGGAEIENQVANGALLLASARDVGGGAVTNTWAARSKGTVKHRTRAYVIQMQLAGLTSTQLAGELVYIDSATGFSSLATLESGLGFYDPASYTLIGGGGSLMPPNLTPTGALVESRPFTDGTKWRVMGKAHTGTVSVKVYTIGIRTCPRGFGGCLSSRVRSVDGPSGAGYATVSDSTPGPWVTLNIGATANSSGPMGRYLADLIPFNGSMPGVRARSLNFGGADTSHVTGWQHMLYAPGAPQSFNAVVFQPGGILFDGAGTLKKTSATSPFTDDHKWSLEPITSWRYRLRNANPAGGGSCAFWPGSGTTVSVGSCSGTAAEWDVYNGAITGVFQLKNVSAGLCLDNDGQPYSGTFNVKLKPCVFGSPQSLFLDAYGWP